MKKYYFKLSILLWCCTMFISCTERFEYFVHESSGQFYLKTCNMDPAKGDLYAATDELVTYCPNIKAYLLDHYTTRQFFDWIPMEAERAFAINLADDGSFNATSQGKNEAIRIVAQGADENSDFVYEVDTLLPYRIGGHYDNLKIVLTPRHRKILFKPNPAHAGDKITDLGTYHANPDPETAYMMLYYVEKATGDIVDSTRFYRENDWGQRQTHLALLYHYNFKGAVIPSTLKPNTEYEIRIDTVTTNSARGYFDSIDFWTLP